MAGYFNDLLMARNGAYHLAEERNITQYQPVRQNNFRFQLRPNDALQEQGFLKPGYFTYNENSTVTADEAVDIIDFSVVSFTPPHFKQEEIQIKKQNSSIYFAGVPSFETGSLVINDFFSADGKSILLAWQALSYNVLYDTIPSADKYKMDGIVYEYLPDGQIIRYWILQGCWVSGLNEDGWNAENGGKKTVTANIRFDRAMPFSGVED